MDSLERITRLEAEMEHTSRRLDAHILECQALRIRIEHELKHLQTMVARISMVGIVAIAAIGPVVSFLLQKLFGG